MRQSNSAIERGYNLYSYFLPVSGSFKCEESSKEEVPEGPQSVSEGNAKLILANIYLTISYFSAILGKS